MSQFHRNKAVAVENFRKGGGDLDVPQRASELVHAAIIAAVIGNASLIGIGPVKMEVWLAVVLEGKTPPGSGEPDSIVG